MGQNNLIQEAKQREDLLNMVINAANVLLSVNDEKSFEAALSKSFKLVGDCFDVDRVQIWRNEIINEELHFVLRYEWLSDYGDSLAFPVNLFFPYSRMPEWEKLFLSNRNINAPLSALSQDEKDFLHSYQSHDLKSIVIIPMFLKWQVTNDKQQTVDDKDNFWGFLCINDYRRERMFSDGEINILTSVGLMMSNAVNRNLQNAKIIKENENSLAMTHWYKSILNAIPLPISVTDKDANLTFINSATDKVFNATHKGLLGKPCSNLGSHICNTPECGIECIKRGVNKTYFAYNDLSFEVDIAVLKDLTNEIMGYVEVVHDVTNLKIMAKKQADTEAANLAKSSFLARMSHEIRSPMNVILGITEMQLEKEDLPKGIREALGKVYSSAYLLLNLINDLLDFSKIEADKLELTPVNYDVPALISDTVQLNVMRFDNKPIQFELKADENIPVTLFGDELRIKQILNNLLTNAFKYTDFGKVTMTVNAEYKTQEQGEPQSVMLIFSISDTGKGMTTEEVDKLFDEYTRFNLEANRATEGTGLGMNITNRLVHLMNGEILVESEVGKGTVFTVKLPQGIVPGAEVFGKDLAENINMLSLGKKAQIKKSAQVIREYMPYGRILVVDDMEPNLYVARGLLSPYGLSIETASSGMEAVERIKKGSRFDIIFMDHFMPGMDGIEAAKAIRELGYDKPIVALTANALAGQADMFLENGFDGFISKPIDIRQLNDILNKLVRDRYPIETIEEARRLKDSLAKKTTSENMDLSYMKALVVDDFLPNLNVAAGMLRKYKMQVDCVLNGQDAINRIESRESVYDIIFMDYQMPDMNGVETTRQIRSIDTDYAKNIPIIALTAEDADKAGVTDNSTLEQMFLDNSFYAVLHKPLSFLKLDTFMKSWIYEKILKNTSGKEKKMKVDIPGIDKMKIIELYDGDMEIYLPVLRSYLSVIPAALTKMRAVSAETLPAYIVSVHGVKGTSESIGAENARKMAAELEALAKAGNLSGVLAKNETLISYVEELLHNIEAWLAQND